LRFNRKNIVDFGISYDEMDKPIYWSLSYVSRSGSIQFCSPHEGFLQRFSVRNNKPMFIFIKYDDPIVYISSLDFKIAPFCHIILQNNNFEREYLMPV